MAGAQTGDAGRARGGVRGGVRRTRCARQFESAATVGEKVRRCGVFGSGVERREGDRGGRGGERDDGEPKRESESNRRRRSLCVVRRGRAREGSAGAEF